MRGAAPFLAAAAAAAAMAAPAAAQSALPPDPTVIGNVEAVRACLSVGDYLRKLGSVAAVSEEQGDAAAEARRLEASARYLNAVRLLKVIGGPESRRIAGDAQGGVPWVESLAYLCAERGDCDEGKAEAAVEVALSLEAACAREYRTGR